MSIPTKSSLFACLALAALAGTASAANISLTASDPINTSSFNSAGKWSDAQSPAAGNDYFTGGYFMRTPVSSGNTTFTFAGNSLTLNQPTIAGVRSVIVKSANNDTYVINNFTNAFGGIFENGGSGNVVNTLAGNSWTIAADSAVVANQGSWIINSPLIGASGVILTNAGGNAAGITYSGDNSAFKGKFYISTVNFGNGGGATRVILNGVNSRPANPDVFTPDQIRLEAGCTLQDNLGLTFNSPNGGITLAGNATIDAAATTTIFEPITGGFALTKAGAGTLVLNGTHSYSGGTVVAAGTLQIGASGALPVGNLTVNGALDLNGFSTTVNALSGAGTVDSTVAGTVTLTVGTTGGGGTFTGNLQNSGGTLNLTKVGAGTLTLANGFSHGGRTLVEDGRLIVSATGVVPPVPGDLVVSNSATLTIDGLPGGSVSANNVTVGTNSTLALAIFPSATALNVSGTMTLQANATNRFEFGTLLANPGAPAISAGGIATVGNNIVIRIEGVGFQTGVFPLIQYGGAAPSLANFVLSTPPGIVASLQINAGTSTLEVNIASAANILTWHGMNGTAWDLTTVNWKDAAFADVVYQQYTNNSVISADAARFDDTLFNDFVNPQPTNIVLNTTVYPFPLTVDSTLPYRISGSGGIAGTTSLVKSNTGSLTLSTANSYSGGTYVYGGSLFISNDSALGAAGVPVTLGGGTLEYAGNTTSARPVAVTAASSIGVSAGATAELTAGINAAAGVSKVSDGALTLAGSNFVNGVLAVRAGTLNVNSGTLRFTGNPSYVAYLTGTATLNLSGSGTLISAGELRVGGSDTSGAGFDAYGNFNMTGGDAYLSALNIARGNNNQNSAAGEVNISGGTMISTNDVIIGFAGTGKGTLRISDSGTVHVGTTVTKWLRFGQWDGTSGEIEITGGNLNLNQGSSIKFNQNNSSGPKTFNHNGGAVTFYSDFATTPGGGGNLDLMLTGTTAATNTYNLNGGTLTVPQVTSSGSSGTRIFNFNGGTLRPTASSSTFFNLRTGNAVANVRNSGAIIDDLGFSVTFAQALVHSTIAGDNATDGGVTKRGTGSVTLNGANSFNGPISVEAGSLLMTTASALSGNLTISDNATLSIAQVGSDTKNVGNLTFDGGIAAPGATLGLALTLANDPAVALINSGTLTLNGNNTISLAGAVNVGTIKLIRALGVVSGAGTLSNLVLPQGAQGSISSNFDGTHTTISVVITSTGPGLTWTGGVNNLWDINTSLNWLLDATPTTYQQSIIPGDAVTFNDTGSGTVIVNANVGPASLTISNSSTAYTFSGNGNIAGQTALVKLGTGAAVLNLTNNSYTGDTIINGGTLQFGVASGLPTSGNLVVGTNGKLQLAGLSMTVKELTGSGQVDNNTGVNPLLTIGSSSGGTWNGTIANSGGGGVALRKVGTGTWVVGGTNHLDNGQSFDYQNQINQGTVIITNGGWLGSRYLQVQIANGAGQTGTVVVAGGTLSVTNNVLSVGYGAETADGTLIVNSGTVDHSGLAPGSFGAVANSIDVGAQGATGRLIVNGGQVLNDQPLFLGDGATANGTLQLNGGLVRASVVQPNGTPLSSVIYFNGGTLQAATNSADFIQSSAFVQSGGAVIDDGGWDIALTTQSLQEDSTSPGGGMVKQGSGTMYLNSSGTLNGTIAVSNGVLAGYGSIIGPVIVGPLGKIGGGDATAIGTLSIFNSLAIQGGATFRIAKDGGFPTSDLISGLTSVNYGGNLVISNATSDATPLAEGDTFTLFSSAAHAGNFTGIVGSPGTGLSYAFANGVLSVVAGGTATNPTNITATVSGNTMTLTWPETHLGWILQTQTNSLSTGLTPTWFDVPGSEASTQAMVNVDQANPTRFFRLRSP